MVSHIFLLVLCKLVSARPKDLKKAVQSLDSTSLIQFMRSQGKYTRLLEIARGCLEASPKKQIVPCESACCQLGFIWIDKPKDLMPNSKAYEAPFRA